MQDTATFPNATTADEARREILEATARLIQSGNTAILPDGRIVPRGTPGAMDYQSANQAPEQTSIAAQVAADIKAALEARQDAMMKGMILRAMTSKPEPPRPPGMENEPAWIPCPDCDDHWCNLHGTHTHECACPPIEEWDSDPYSPPARPPITVVMFQRQFEAPIVAGTKHHTIRRPRKRPINPGAILSLRVWEGLPYRSKQREFMTVPLLRTEGVAIHRDGVELSPGTLRAFWMGEKGKRRELLEAFARADGFATWKAMREWFEATHGLARPFEGTLIRWKE